MTLNISMTQHAHDPQPHPTVGDVQANLIHRGYNVGKWGADGDFGDYTDAAVRSFQRKLGLSVDGVVGPDTWRKLSATPAHTTTSAAKMADIAYALVTGKTDGSRPRYVFGSECSLTDPSPDKLDCSELVQWAVYQADGHHDWRDGSSNQAGACHIVSTATAVKTKGALLFLSSNGHTSGVHHVAVSMGNGYTAEARSTDSGCGSWAAAGRFSFGGLVPVLKY